MASAVVVVVVEEEEAEAEETGRGEELDIGGGVEEDVEDVEDVLERGRVKEDNAEEVEVGREARRKM